MLKRTYFSKERCHCGKDVMSHEIGYCEKCFAKRNEFIDRFLDSIELEIEQENVLVAPYDALRKTMLADRIGFLVDNYINRFGNEPYTDSAFYLRALSEKVRVLSEIAEDLKVYTNISPQAGSMTSFVSNAYLKYLRKIVNIYTSDINIINSLNTNSTNKTQMDIQKLVLESQKNGN